ncbi:MAG: hypothetical protein LBU89_02685 [Fibromonadaceae bacterium]|jgi:hypothetical protein|nr:hypothetical protein [Fibromonadaceae bacterium]
MQKFIIFNDTIGRHQFINCLHLIRCEVKQDSNHPGILVKFFLSDDKDIEWSKRCTDGNVKLMQSTMESKVADFFKSDERVLELG